MSSRPALELATLPSRHPRIGLALLLYAPSTVFRLRVDPTPLGSATLKRDIEINWRGRVGKHSLVQESCEIGWSNLSSLSEDLLIQLPITIPEHTLTEQAAIGVMAMVIHELEGGQLIQVLQIGSGGDYLVITENAKRAVQVEVSGILLDTTGSESISRLRKKSDQVLTHSRSGFASVTTFAHGPDRIVQSDLHFVTRESQKKKRGKRR